MSNTYSVDRLQRAVAHFVGGRTVQALARAGLVLLIVRLLPAADFGAYMLIVGVSEMLLQLSSFGVLAVGQRFLPQIIDSAASRHTRRFVWVITVVQMLILAAVCGALWWSWDTLLGYLGFTPEQVVRSRHALWLFLLVPAFRFVADLLEALLEQGRAQIVRAIMPVGRAACILALLAFGMQVDMERILLVDVAVTLACLALAWVLMLGSLSKLVEPEHPQPLPVRDMVRHARHMATVEIVGSTQAPGALRIVVANSLGIVESGLFAFLQSLQRLVGRYLPGVLLRGLVRPMLISRAANQNGLRLLERGIGLLLKANLLAVAAAAMVVFVGGDRLVMLASGGKFPESGDTLLLMFLALALTSQRQMLEMLMQILNQTHILRITIWLAPLTLAAVWLTAEYGLNTAVVVSAIGVGLINAINLWRLRTVTGQFRVGWWGTANVVLPALGAALFGYLLQSVAGTWVAMAGALVLLAILMAVVKPFGADEFNIASRGVGSLAGRVLQPFVRKAAL